MVVGGNPAYFVPNIKEMEYKFKEIAYKFKGIGYRRPGNGETLTRKSFEINVPYFRKAIADLMTRVLKIRYHTQGSMPPSQIDTQISTFVPHIVNMCMSALYAKLRSVNNSHGLHATRYTSPPTYTKDIKLPLPLALAIHEFGAFETRCLLLNYIMVPTYPEATQNEGRTTTEVPFAEYISYVPTLQELGIPLKCVDVDVGATTDSAWWTYKVEVVRGITDFVCTLPRSNYSDMSALLRMLFLFGLETSSPEDLVRFEDGVTSPPEDLVRFEDGVDTYGTLVHRLTPAFNARTFLALIHGPAEEWSFRASV